MYVQYISFLLTFFFLLTIPASKAESPGIDKPSVDVGTSWTRASLTAVAFTCCCLELS